MSEADMVIEGSVGGEIKMEGGSELAYGFDPVPNPYFVGPAQHIYNHYDERPPYVNVEVSETTRGRTCKIELKYVTAENLGEALGLYMSALSLVQEKEKEDDAE